MSDTWNQGYFTDVGYTHDYYREIDPVFQRFCLLANGLAASEAAESGDAGPCGAGLWAGGFSQHPRSGQPRPFREHRFNPAQAAHASALAWAAGRGARLYDDSIEQLLARTDLPQFDSISLHGIWTWVKKCGKKWGQVLQNSLS